MPTVEQYTVTWREFSEEQPPDYAIFYVRRKSSTICAMKKCVRRGPSIFFYNEVLGEKDYIYIGDVNDELPYVWCYTTDIITGTDAHLARAIRYKRAMYRAIFNWAFIKREILKYLRMSGTEKWVNVMSRCISKGELNKKWK